MPIKEHNTLKGFQISWQGINGSHNMNGATQDIERLPRNRKYRNRYLTSESETDSTDSESESDDWWRKLSILATITNIFTTTPGYEYVKRTYK